MTINQATSQIIGAAIAVHRELGPGLLESTYEACMVVELVERGLRVERQRPVPVIYKKQRLDCGYRIDLLIEDKIVVELKAVSRFESVHTAQLLSYLRLSGYPAGLLINFNVALLKYGIRRVLL